MKPVSPQLLTLLASREFFAADLFTFILSDGGTTLRYCAGDKDVTWDGKLYSATGTFGTGSGGGPYFDREDSKAKIHQKIGIEVDTMSFDVIPGTSTIIGEPFLKACHDGIFDGAIMHLDRAFMPVYGNTAAGVVPMFQGRVGEVDAGRSLATFTVNSALELLNQNLPRNLYQPGCINNLGDAACGVNLEAYRVNLSVLTAPSRNAITATISLPFAGYFDLGKVVFTSGALIGQSRSVRSAISGTITFIAPFSVAPSAGDTFALYPGCDKSLGTNGCPKFSNTARFRGFPFIPQPIVAI